VFYDHENVTGDDWQLLSHILGVQDLGKFFTTNMIASRVFALYFEDI